MRGGDAVGVWWVVCVSRSYTVWLVGLQVLVVGTEVGWSG